MIHLDDLLQATGGWTHGPTFGREFADFCYDTRLLHAGELFLAVKTETGDGHDYVLQACRDGAAGVVAEREFDLSEFGATLLVVDNTQQALTDWARFILGKYGTEVIGITGSSGKTTTKEAIAHVLGVRFSVFKNYANYNGRYGLPIALGRLEPSHEKAVLEMACDGFDEIRLLAGLTRPKVGIVTAVNPTHIEYLGSLEQIAVEKGRLVEALPPQGVAILNYDDERVRAMASRTRARVVFYGMDERADVRAKDVQLSANGAAFTLASDGHETPVRFPLLGRHNVYAALASACVGMAYGMAPEAITERLAEFRPQPGRLNPLPGENDSVILDDTYNSSPAAALAALDTLAAFPRGGRIAVLGDMLQLGEHAEDYHRAVGRRAAQTADFLVTQGELARLIALEAMASGMAQDVVSVVYTGSDAVAAVERQLHPGSVVLVKGAQELRMEQVTEALLAQPESSRDALVRQNSAWQQVRLVRPGRPTWVEVNLDSIAHNVGRIAEIVGPKVDVMAVLKADAYGHGAVKVARTALNNGATCLGVACLGEAVELRRAGIAAPILILGFTPAWQTREAVLHDTTVALFSLDVARALSRAAGDLHARVRVHVKADTGMGRLGLLPGEVVPFVRAIHELPNLDVEGIFTHFATADSADESHARAQLDVFLSVLDDLGKAGFSFRYVHAANSAATLSLPESRFNLVRPGIAMFGLNPSPDVACPPDFQRALAFKCQVAQVKELPPGSCVSYGCTYRTPDWRKIAVIPVGYADGFRRAPAHWGDVLVKGRRAPIVGRVCMDQTMVDVTDIPDVRQGDEVVLIGRQGTEEITADEVATHLGTINYEVVSEILARVPRVS
jgi:alanine racemase